MYIVTSRSKDPEVEMETRKELKKYGIVYDELYLLPDKNDAEMLCPHNELDWYQKYIWQKVNYCLENDIGVFYDDEQKVVELFQEYAPEILVFKVM